MPRNLHVSIFLLVGLASFLLGYNVPSGVGASFSPIIRLEPFVRKLSSTVVSTAADLVQDGVKMYVKTVDKIANTFGKVEDRIRAVLQLLKNHIANGIPEIGIPALDPLNLEKVKFNINHEAATLKGYIENVTIKHISKFNIDKCKILNMGNLQVNLDLNLTFPILTANGVYNVSGVIGNSIKVFGDGNFWLNLYNFNLLATTIIQYEYTRLRMVSLNVEIEFERIENDFENLMYDKKIGALFNKAITKLAPDAVEILWPEIKVPIEDEVLKYINNLLGNASITNLLKTLLNIM